MVLNAIAEDYVDRNLENWTKLLTAVFESDMCVINHFIESSAVFIQQNREIDVRILRKVARKIGAMSILFAETAEYAKRAYDIGWLLYVIKHNRIPTIDPNYGRRVFYLPAKMPEK